MLDKNFNVFFSFFYRNGKQKKCCCSQKISRTHLNRKAGEKNDGSEILINFDDFDET
jgi:hypothetical protein